MGYYTKQNRKRKILGHKIKSLPNQKCTAKKITEIFSNSFLVGKRCFLLAGGPSLKGFNYSVLKNEFTIGINKTFTVFSPNINYSMDLKFYNYISKPGNEQEQKKIHAQWLDYTGYKVFLCPKKSYNFEDNLYVVDRIDERVLSFDLTKGIYGGNNSGFGALMLAISLGSKVIYLLGYDFKMSGDSTHWHSGYWNQNSTSYDRKLFRFKQLFDEFASHIKDLGIEIVNLNVDSELNCFSKSSINEVLKS